MIFNVLQFLLILFIFRMDSPKYYSQKGNREGEEAYNAKILGGEVVQDTTLNNEDTDEKVEEPSWKDLVGPRFRLAFFVGCVLSGMQQVTGINAVVFYSTDIFKNG